MPGQRGIEHIVVAGGGAAGWLTACVLAADHCAAEPGGLKITLVESATVPILGVGEGTWPTMRDTLRRIGISETAFLRRCQASFKQGTRFIGWHTGSDDDVYYHPFEAPPDPDTIDPLVLWSAARGRSFAEAVCHQPRLCAEDMAPKQPGTPEFAAVANYGYHLDAPAFAELLKEHGTERLGVHHVVGDILGAERGEGGLLNALVLSDDRRVDGDLFIDCTGSRALLIEGEMARPVTDVSHILFNDRALAIQVPYAADDSPVPSQTNGTAMDAGWVWDIALQARRGVGYVHASSFSEEGEARQGLQSYLDRTAKDTPVAADDARLITFQSGYRQAPWAENVVAIGMASGFVEPLEASALVMAELSADLVSTLMPAHTGELAAVSSLFNERFTYRWERIVDFLKLHYVLSKRNGAYWDAHRDPETWPPRLAELLERWRRHVPSREDFVQNREIFPAASYAYVLYGMGFETQSPPHRRRRADPRRADQLARSIDMKTAKFHHGLPTNRDLINHVLTHGLTRS